MKPIEGKLMTTTGKIKHYIHGRLVDTEGGRQQDVFNPATGKVSAQVVLASDADVPVSYTHLTLPTILLV